ncbi:helix-turn-helix domain-containing protein [Paenibacillus guangzhouensis]|uniref:helix-turn-helix domain-containing protein n=1 Tax=Paenibacillus guangzhouensis TaxID=1473112 RepID=UPI0012670D0E|nr:helix-turn-helix domain-containing protein [Paenibacillus guangzhouensis]
MFKQDRGSLKVWIHFFIPYALLLTGFLGVGLYAYDRTTSLVESHTKETAYAFLEQTKEILDRRFTELETIAEQAASSTKVQSFQYVDRPFAGTNPIRILELKKDLFDYSLFNHFLLNYYMIFPHSEFVVSPRSSYSLRQFYDLEFRNENQSYEDWLKELKVRTSAKTFFPGRTATFQNKHVSVVTYMQSFGSQERSGIVLMLIDNAQIQSMLHKLDSSNGGFVVITDAKGEIISRTGANTDIRSAASLTDGFNPIDIDGQRMLVTKTTSRYNGWTYLTAQPESYVLEKVNSIKQLILTIMLIGLVLGLFAALLFSYRNSRPLWMLLRMLPTGRMAGGHSPNRNAWDFVRTSVTNLIVSHDYLSEKMDQQVPLIRSGFYDRLLRGHYLSNKDIAAAMEHSRETWEGEYFAVSILMIAGYEGTYSEAMLTELDFRKIAIRDIIATGYGRTISTHDLGENQIGLLLNGDAASPSSFMDEVRNHLTTLHHRIAGALSVQVYITVGGCYTQLTEISRSYEEARLLREREHFTEQRPIMFHDEESPALPTYYYPPDVELRLINLVKSGNVPETELLLDQIRQNNLEQNHLPVAVTRVLIHELTGTLLKCCESEDTDRQQDEVKSALAASEANRTPKSAFEQLVVAFLYLCRQQHDRKKSHNNQLKQDLIQHLEEHYMRTELSLSELAERFNYAEAYISYFFKEQTGVNFSDYLESIRMNHARRLLQESDMSVNEIAGWVGYYSLNSFSRAFKRANGVSATEFRRQARSGI